MSDDISKVMRTLRDVERKLDVLIEAQGLERRLAEREEQNRTDRAERAAATADALKRSRPSIP